MFVCKYVCLYKGNARQCAVALRKSTHEHCERVYARMCVCVRVCICATKVTECAALHLPTHERCERVYACMCVCVCVCVRACVGVGREKVSVRRRVVRQHAYSVKYENVRIFENMCKHVKICVINHRYKKDSTKSIIHHPYRNMCTWDQHVTMGWLRLVGSLKLYVYFAEYRLFYMVLLQKRSIILRSLLIVATPYGVARIARFSIDKHLLQTSCRK